MTDSGRRAGRALVLVLAVMLLALILAALSGRRAGPAAPAVRATPSAEVAAPNGLDLLFAKMMVAHHAQAVSMSRTLLAMPGVPERARNLAGFIEHDQQREIDDMNAWLRAWGRPPVDLADPALQQLHGDGAGHGMVTGAQLAEIARAKPPAATERYLRHMIEHHLGAITMARSALGGGANAYVHVLAEHIINEQSAEIDAMRRLLAELNPKEMH